MRVIKLKKVKRINGLHYAPDGRLLVVSGSEAGAAGVCVWVDPTAGAELHRFDLAGECYAVSPTVSTIAVSDPGLFDGDGGSFLVCRDLSTVPVVTDLHPTDEPGTLEVFGLAFDPTGKTLAVSFARDDDGAGYDCFSVIPMRGLRKRIEND